MYQNQVLGYNFLMSTQFNIKMINILIVNNKHWWTTSLEDDY